MGVKVRLTEGAAIERTKLPRNVQDDLERRFGELADTPGPPGKSVTDSLLGISPDGSRFDVIIVHRFDDGEGELWIEIIDIFSY